MTTAAFIVAIVGAVYCTVFAAAAVTLGLSAGWRERRREAMHAEWLTFEDRRPIGEQVRAAHRVQQDACLATGDHIAHEEGA